MACKSGDHRVQPRLERGRLVHLGQLVGQITQQGRRVRSTERGGQCPDQHRAGAKTLDQQTKPGEFASPCHQSRGVAGRQLDH